MDRVFNFLQLHYEFVLIIMGLLIIIGTLKDWKWLTEYTVGDRARYAFIFEMWGEKGYRVFIGFCGFIIALCGTVFWVIKYKN